jgi:hypothetical protein
MSLVLRPSQIPQPRPICLSVSHVCLNIIFNSINSIPSGLFSRVLRYCMHILAPRSEVGVFRRYTVNLLVLQTEWLRFFGSIMFVI